MKNRILSTSLLAVVFLLFFCGIIRHDVNETQYTNLANEKQFDCVGQVFIDTSERGSCVLIGERFVLSAAHAFIESDYRLDTMEFQGKTIITNVPFNNRLVNYTKVSIKLKGETVRIKKIILHPNYLDSTTEKGCDMALLELEAPIKKSKPTVLNWKTDERNANVVGVGFGVTDIADKLETGTPINKKLAGQNVVDSVGGFEYLGVPTLLFCDFDHPTRNDCNKMGSSTPQPLEYLCAGGDSGGGLFRKNNDNHWELIGICSGGPIDIQQFMSTVYYGQIMYWTRVSAFKQWILDNTK